VALVGEHDTYSAGRLEGELTVLLDEGRHVVVDLREAEFIDSSTLGVLLNASRDAEHAGLGFTLVLASRTYTQVNQLLDLTGHGSAFAIYDNRDNALSAARRGESGVSVRSAA